MLGCYRYSSTKKCYFIVFYEFLASTSQAVERRAHAQRLSCCLLLLCVVAGCPLDPRGRVERVGSGGLFVGKLAIIIMMYTQQYSYRLSVYATQVQVAGA